MNVFDGRVALVTGGGRGIGRGVALALAHFGAKVAVTARSTDEIEAVATQIKAQGGDALAVTGDVSNLADVQRIISETTAKLGAVDILFNNAGIIGPLNKLEDTDPALWVKTQEINVFGAYYCLREVLPGMKARNWGRVINISSGAANNNGMPHAAAYSISKLALDMLAKNVSIEVADMDIRINSVAPGVVDTGMVEEIRTTQTSHPNMRGRFNEMKAEGAFSDPQYVGKLLVAVMLGDWRGAVLDVRNIPDELNAILAEHDA